MWEDLEEGKGKKKECNYITVSIRNTLSVMVRVRIAMMNTMTKGFVKGGFILPCIFR